MSPTNRPGAIITDLIERAREMKRARGQTAAQAGAVSETDDAEEDEDESATDTASTVQAANDTDEDDATAAPGYRTVKGIVRPASAISNDVASVSTGSLTPTNDSDSALASKSSSQLRNAFDDLKISRTADAAGPPPSQSGASLSVPSPLSRPPTDTPNAPSRLSTASVSSNHSAQAAHAAQAVEDKRASVSSAQTTGSTAPVVGGQKNVFKAARLCRLARRVNCADFTGDALLLGVDDGLYAFEMEGLHALPFVASLAMGSLTLGQMANQRCNRSPPGDTSKWMCWRESRSR